MGNGSKYGNIPYEVDEITTWMNTYFDDNLPGMIEDAITTTRLVFLWNAMFEAPLNFVKITGTWVISGIDAWNSSRLINTSASQNDAVVFGAFDIPESGTYTLNALVRTQDDCGIAHIIINGVDSGTIDGYGGTVSNVSLTTSLGTLTPGLKIISFIISTKHASSSGYGFMLHALEIVKT